MKSINSNYEVDNKKTTKTPAKRANTRRNFIMNVKNKEKKARGWKKGHKAYYDNGIKFTYNGKKYESIATLCRELNIKLSSFRSYLTYRFKYMSEEEREIERNNIGSYVDGYLKKHSKYTAPDGTVYDSFSDCCRKTGVLYGTAYNRIKRKSCPEDQIFSKERFSRMGKNAYDHLGNEYPSISAMCRYYNVTFSEFDKNLISGMSLKKALTGED